MELFTESGKTMADLRTGILDALYQEYGKYVSLAERTSHDTRIKSRHKSDGILLAIRIVEGFEPEPLPAIASQSEREYGPRPRMATTPPIGSNVYTSGPLGAAVIAGLIEGLAE